MKVNLCKMTMFRNTPFIAHLSI